MSSTPFHNWMSQVYAHIKDTPLCQLPLPGSHDAIAYPDIMLRSQTQNKDITAQLDAGYRYFDFRVKMNGDVFYGVHGGDNTEHDYVALGGQGNQPYVLDDIANWLKQPEHRQELVFLCFSHLVAHGDQTFDPMKFLPLLLAHLHGLLVPRAITPTSLFRECIDDQNVGSNRQVVAIIDDDPSWYDDPAYIGHTAWFWSVAACVRDYYSGVRFDVRGGAALDDLTAKIDKTLADQEEHLRNDRDANKLFITQAVLDYFPWSYEGNSQNYLGAREMNPRFAHVFEHCWWQGRDSTGKGSMPRPNILLMDFVGEFDRFPEACMRMVNPPAAPELVSGTRYTLQSNTYQSYLAEPAYSTSWYYARTDPKSTYPHRFVKKQPGAQLRSGDEVYLLAAINGGEAFLRTSSAASNDLWYEAGSHPQSEHTWRIRKVAPRGADDIIRVGDTVTLKSVDESAYMEARGHLDYVSLTSDRRTWVVESAA